MTHDKMNNSGSHCNDTADDVVSWTYNRAARPSGPLICHTDKAAMYNTVAPSAKSPSSLIADER